MHPSKLKNLLSMSSKERFEYFIRQVVQFEEVWVLDNGQGYAVFKDPTGDEIFPVWPEQETAKACIFQEHIEMGFYPVSIKLESFLNNCIPDMILEKVLFGVFYNTNREGFCVTGEVLEAELRKEYNEIWG